MYKIIEKTEFEHQERAAINVVFSLPLSAPLKDRVNFQIVIYKEAPEGSRGYSVDQQTLTALEAHYISHGVSGFTSNFGGYSAIEDIRALISDISTEVRLDQ